jgi:hypothetical protein
VAAAINLTVMLQGIRLEQRKGLLKMTYPFSDPESIHSVEVELNTNMFAGQILHMLIS